MAELWPIALYHTSVVSLIFLSQNAESIQGELLNKDNKEIKKPSIISGFI